MRARVLAWPDLGVVGAGVGGAEGEATCAEPGTLQHMAAIARKINVRTFLLVLIAIFGFTNYFVFRGAVL